MNHHGVIEWVEQTRCAPTPDLGDPRAFLLVDAHVHRFHGERTFRNGPNLVPFTSYPPAASPAAEMIAEAVAAHAIVLGGKGDNIGNLLLGSTALQVVGHARCRVIVVGHASAGHNRIPAGPSQLLRPLPEDNAEVTTRRQAVEEQISRHRRPPLTMPTTHKMLHFATCPPAILHEGVTG